MKYSSIFPLPALFWLLSLAACAAPTEIGNDLSIETIRPDAPESRLSLNDLYGPRESAFRITRGELAGKSLTITIDRVGDRGTITRALDDADTLSEQRFEVDDGAVIERGFRNHERDVIVQLRPDQRLWPIDGETQEMDIRIVKLEDPETVKERGEATSTMTIESLDTVTTPAGVFEAVRVRTAFESDLRAAKARRITERWYAPGEGLIAERFDETVTALGIPIEKTARTIVRTP
jgi:hypothetical protein